MLKQHLHRWKQKKAHLKAFATTMHFCLHSKMKMQKHRVTEAFQQQARKGEEARGRRQRRKPNSMQYMPWYPYIDSACGFSHSSIYLSLQNCYDNSFLGESHTASFQSKGANFCCCMGKLWHALHLWEKKGEGKSFTYYNSVCFLPLFPFYFSYSWIMLNTWDLPNHINSLLHRKLHLKTQCA